MNEESPLRKADLVMPDGNIYTYGDNNECFHCRYQNRMYIYMPWVEKLNDGKQYIVRSGLAAGDIIVIEGVGTLRDGMQITLKDERKEK